MTHSLRTLFVLQLLLALGVGCTTPRAMALSESGTPSQKSAFVLLTDVDDTIKVSHIMDPIGKILRFFQEPIAFAGMSKLYNELLDEANRQGRDHGFATVSGTPFLLEYSIWDFLEEFGFPGPGVLSTRPIGMATYEFKSDEIAKILDSNSLNGADLLMVGDDTEHDHAAYVFAKQNVADLRKMNTQIFIRRVSGQAANSGETFAFDSAADIAVVQFANGRLSEAALAKVFAEVETEQRLERLFVPGEYCPDASSPRLSRDSRVAGISAPVLKRLEKVENHLRRVCEGLSLWFRNN